ncbi:hypothetical protein [Natronosalvus rutilus]|uniref:Uncharacterized protein n=1 Tax=Natronosalvus rutilus TaxID=2953753 RepID=A0A9E7N8E7_9EURY|nr:hypothetical protein [Natronosalvus rutilus]UTF52771.1 hypothetical protein NGM29_13390 [Natronosalvus rutilus]
MSQKPENPGRGNGPDRPEYQIDETVTLPRDDPLKYWDIDVDPNKKETWVIRAIARSPNTNIRAYILPKEEVAFFEEDENVWWEFRSENSSRLKDATTITNEDEHPYFHDGDYVLAIKAKRSGGTPDEFKFSVKFRRE